jgi:hypothetical protein
VGCLLAARVSPCIGQSPARLAAIDSGKRISCTQTKIGVWDRKASAGLEPADIALGASAIIVMFAPVACLNAGMTLNQNSPFYVAGGESGFYQAPLGVVTPLIQH